MVKNPPPRDSLIAQLVKNLPAMREAWAGKIPQRRERLPTPVSGLENSMDLEELDTTECLSLSLFQESHGQRNLAGYSP